MSIGAIGGGDQAERVQQLIRELISGAKNIVRETFIELDKFKSAMDEAAKKEAFEKITEKLAQLKKMVENMSAAIVSGLSLDIGQIQDAVDELRMSTNSSEGIKQMSKIQALVDELKAKMGGTV